MIVKIITKSESPGTVLSDSDSESEGTVFTDSICELVKTVLKTTLMLIPIISFSFAFIFFSIYYTIDILKIKLC